MVRNDRLNVILFALTGFGNTVLKALLKDTRVDLNAVFTIKYDHPFPYYPEQQLTELCRERRIKCYHGINVNGEQGICLLQAYSPALIIVATFKQILTKDVLDLPKLGVVNIHPSLLPRYRGPCPTQAALLNGEEATGITVHYITEKPDEGNILFRTSLTVNKSDNDGRLRQKLANLAGETIFELIEMFADFKKPDGIPQDHSLATYAPRPKIEDAYLIPDVEGIDMIHRKIRAYNPLPGTSILVKDRRVAVDLCEFCKDDRNNGVYEQDDCIVIVKDSRAVKLCKKVDVATDDNLNSKWGNE